MSKVERALLSVSDKSGIVELARALAAAGVQIISTGGTAKLLEKERVKVTEVSAHTGFAEMLDGRVKTLHPKIHGGLLARRDDRGASRRDPRRRHRADRPRGGQPLSLRATVADPDCRLEDAIENIDIGGPAMLRSAAKNYGGVAVVVDPADYPRVLDELRRAAASREATRFALAKKAFAHTAAYDGAIANYLTSSARNGQFPEVLTLQLHKLQDLRYGENPHQSAAFYRDAAAGGRRPRALPAAAGQGALVQQHRRRRRGVGMREELQPSRRASSSSTPTRAASRSAPTLREAYARAFATDPVSAFGGILAFNRALDRATAEAIGKQFAEVIIAPRVEAEAQKALAGKANLRVLEVPLAHDAQAHDYKRVGGGLLVQSSDAQVLKRRGSQGPRRRKSPPTQQMRDLLFAWRVAKFVKSNAIVFCARRRHARHRRRAR